MAKGYRPVPRDQAFLLPPDMRAWLPEGHPVWLVIEAVRLLDTSAFHAGRKTGGAGAAGYDPDMLVTLLVWAYANGVTSSRRIEALCRNRISRAFKLICAGDVPDHVTIARFRAGLGPRPRTLFAQVLVLCARLGMGQVGTVAVDGTKVAASAAKDANRTGEGLRKLAADLAARHAEADAAEDALFGAGAAADEVLAELADPRSLRAQRIAAALAELTCPGAGCGGRAAAAPRPGRSVPGPPAARRLPAGGGGGRRRTGPASARSRRRNQIRTMTPAQSSAGQPGWGNCRAAYRRPPARPAP